MQRKTWYIIAATIILLGSILLGLARKDNYDNGSDLLAIFGVTIFVSIVHYFIFIKSINRSYNESILDMKDILVRVTYSRLLCFFSVITIVFSCVLINNYIIDLNYRKNSNETLLIEQKQREEIQLQIDKNTIAVAKVLNVSSGSINMGMEFGGPIYISGDSNYYHLGVTTGLETNLVYLVSMEKEKGLDTLRVITTSQEPQDVFCKKIKIDDSKASLKLLFRFAPQCLSTCEKIQQVIIKGAQFLSKEDLIKISPSCAESFIDN